MSEPTINLDNDKCDLCSQVAGYKLCQEHLDIMDGNDENGVLAVEREGKLLSKIEQQDTIIKVYQEQLEFMKNLVDSMIHLVEIIRQ